jgi:hypothetical protein
MKREIILIFALLLSGNLFAQTTSLIQKGSDGRLVYTPDSDGFVIPDFSYAGYHNGNKEIPDVAVVKTISPIAGDNTTHIQNAINEVGQLALNNGIRGAILLQAGKYEINGTINVNKDGIVLRGEGNSTIIYAKGNTPNQRDVIVMGNSSANRWTSKVSNTQQNITNDIVPVGAMSFTVTSVLPYNVGDLIAVYHPCSANWLQAVDYGGVPASASNEYWKVDSYPVIYHRYITAISGNEITIDAPIFYTLNKSLSQSYIYKIGGTATIKEIGIENLCVEIESAGGTNEAHAWQAVRFRTVENSWARNLTTKGFGQSGFITESCTRTTIENCQAIQPVSLIDGEKRYNFNTYLNSQLILFKDCYASEGRHNYVSNGTSTVSGIVFLNCVSEKVYNTNEGHRHWSQGMLFDGHTEIDLSNRENRFVLGLFNRTDNGTGHGWSAVQSVLWNCDVTNQGIIGLQKPPTSQNYAIGCIAGEITGKPISSTDFPIGYVESHNTKITEIPSLYLAQLNDRKRETSINNSTKSEQEIKIWVQNEKFSIRANNMQKISVCDLQGRILNEQKVTASFIEIPIAKGLFIIRIQTDKNEYIRKIMN